MTDILNEEQTSIPNGKAGLIERIKINTTIKHKQTILGIGDDAAILDYNNSLVVTSSTIFAEGIHFDLTYTPLKHYGYKVVVAAISDILAMNALPRQVSISLAVSNKIMQQHILEFYDGVHAACSDYNIDLIGGDVTTSKYGITIAVTSIGSGEKDKIVYRSGAKVTDLLCVTGDLGGAYMGLQLLEREKSVFNSNPEQQPVLDGYQYILRRQLKPEAQTEVLEYLKSKQIVPTSMICVSNGLAGELINLCRASNVGCEIFEERVPIASDTEKMSKEFNISPIVTALNGGEDYELLFTIPLNCYDKIKDNDYFKVIGSINKREQGCNIVTNSGDIITLEPSVNGQSLKNV